MENICITVASGEFSIGVLVNIFIGLVNYMNWVKTRKISTLDFILTGLAISRIILLCTITSTIILLGSYFKNNLENKLKYLKFPWYLSTLSSAWFDACLNVFLFLKIASFSHPVFLWLKWRVYKLVIRMLMGCLIISLLILLPLTEKTPPIFFYQRNKANISEMTEIDNTELLLSTIFFYMGNLLPFILCLISCFLLVLSLWRHTQKMQLKFRDSRDPSTQAHMKAIKFTISFLFLFALYHVAIIIGVLSLILFANNLTVMFAMIVMAIYPLAHSIILILENSKLRQALLKVFWKLRCHLRKSGRLFGI
ncbi:taste receptor type 2 member 7-like [Gracilinanus agilis]|uniref:taste receptor type 2 member 7-like n=1 Tax=Gracilinanus agilis TaxID=191870 RepID=UPI001CFE49C4|nr:taste receptor type 2 member 7-like [Gracilinanus agilis]